MSSERILPHIVTLTTDFGTEDPYVGSMKGVMLSLKRDLVIVDISHTLPSHQLLPAALLLREACPRFPDNTIHVAVIDPGVGGRRRPLLLKVRNHFFIGPDNGIFGTLIRDLGLESAWELNNPDFFMPSVSNTFHGRDIFSPIAAHLANGVHPCSFGPEISDPVVIVPPLAFEEGNHLKGEVQCVDHFGNCMTNLTRDLIESWSCNDPFRIQAASSEIHGISACYETVPPGRPVALFGSTGYLEIACNQERADRKLGLKQGDPVCLTKIKG